MIPCNGCRFWSEGQDHGSGECHRHAPRPALLGELRAAPGRGETFWPVTLHSDGCEDGQPRARLHYYAPPRPWWRRLLGGRR
jgi:hypothetical protein